MLMCVYSCTINQTLKLMKQGEIVQKEFHVKIPFEYRLGLIVLKVNIKGKEHHFILDTGAPNVISKELAEELNLLKAFDTKAGDSQGNNEKLGFAVVDELEIGGVVFKNTGAAIADLTKSKEVGCLNVEGFIGANLMRKAIWQFNFEDQTITITNDRFSLSMGGDYYFSIPFIQKVTGTPMINVLLGDVRDNNVTVDFGSNGGYKSSKTTFLALQKELSSYLRGYGSASAGLYGGNPDTSFVAKVPSFQIGNITNNDQVIDFSDKGEKSIGLLYFKNYEVTIDWFKEEIVLIQHEEHEGLQLKGFGFSPAFKDDKVYIGFLMNVPDIINSGLAIGDQIIAFDGTDCSNVNENELCGVMEKFREKVTNDQINLKVRNQKGEVKNVSLSKVHL